MNSSIGSKLEIENLSFTYPGQECGGNEKKSILYWKKEKHMLL